MQIAQEIIDNLILRIKKVVEPKEVILFGSAARGLMAHDSDIDVLVVVAEGTHRMHTNQQIHMNLFGFGYPVDVIVATSEDLEKHKNNPGLIYQNILKEGKTVYAANDLPPIGSVERWLRFAESDLYLAKTQLSGDVMIEALCFHAQQAVEKAIKAVLVHFNIIVPRTHVIELIIDKAEQRVEIPKYVREAANLTPYASVTRYPGNYEPRTDADLLDAIQKAEKVVAWAKEICGIT